MPFVPFHDFFPEEAERETRSVTVVDGSDLGLPPARYDFVELYCDERGCDCRRVFFTVFSSAERKPVAVISYGCENAKYYARWLKTDDPAILKEAQGLALNRLSPQSKHAPAVLRMARDMLLQDEVYVDRLKTHYRMVRQRVDHAMHRPLDPVERKRRQRERDKLLAARQRNRSGRPKRRD